MTFEEWFDKDDANYVEDLAKAAYEAGIQEGIQRMYKLYDICLECRETGGRHKMDCGRGRKSDD
jgi:hypothetical protein